MTRAVAVMCLALLLAAAAGCQSSSPPRGTATGILLRVGGMAPGSPVPLPGKVTATSTAGGPTVIGRIGKNGRFRIMLPPGSYRFTGTSPLIGSGKATCTAARPVTIRPARTTSGIKIICSIS